MKKQVTCPKCGKSRMIDITGTYKPNFTGICIKCANGKNQTGENNPCWKGGKSKTNAGYVIVRKPEHPRAWSNGYVFKHILILEEKLGRSLSRGECGHHLNGNKEDNRPENIVLRTVGSHTTEHWTGRHHTEESKRKMSQSKIGRPVSAELRKRRKELSKSRLRDEMTGRWLPCS